MITKKKVKSLEQKSSYRLKRAGLDEIFKMALDTLHEYALKEGDEINVQILAYRTGRSWHTIKKVINMLLEVDKHRICLEKRRFGYRIYGFRKGARIPKPPKSKSGR